MFLIQFMLSLKQFKNTNKENIIHHNVTNRICAEVYTNEILYLAVHFFSF